MNSVTSTYNPTPGNPPKEMASIPSLKFSDGNEIPMMGYGIGTANSKDSGAPLDKDLIATMTMAIKAGYHHLDAAQTYGNEEELGQAIKAAGVPREKLFITTKLQGTKLEDTATAFANSLKKLDVEYVDLYLIHAPFFAGGDKQKLQSQWKDMEALLQGGKVKSIGVSNYLVPDLEAILEIAKVVPVCNQIEYHPYLQRGELIPFHQKHGISTVAYAPLTAVLKGAPGPLDTTYAELASKYGVTPAEIALRWVLDQGIVVLTTSAKEERLRSYQKVGKFKLTPKEVETIAEVGKQKNFRGFWRGRFAEGEFS